jgi:hypothetical protein
MLLFTGNRRENVDTTMSGMARSGETRQRKTISHYCKVSTDLIKLKLKVFRFFWDKINLKTN